MQRIFEQLLLLPIRSFLFGLGMMSETFRGLQRLGEESLEEIEGRSMILPEIAGLPPTLHPEFVIPAARKNDLPDPRAPTAPTALPRAPEPQRAASGTSREPPQDFLENVSEEPSPIATKEEEEMYMDQDLSGDQVKVVQYSIVNVVPGIADNERIIAGPCLVAFSDDMTPEDFTAWIIAEQCPKYEPRPSRDDCCPDAGGPNEFPCFPGKELEKCWDKKYLRVAFTVQGRFSKAAINWEELQALSVAKLVEGLYQSNRKIDHLVQNTTPPLRVEVTDSGEPNKPNKTKTSS